MRLAIVIGRYLLGVGTYGNGVLNVTLSGIYILQYNSLERFLRDSSSQISD
jgi:hypothetical protein